MPAGAGTIIGRPRNEPERRKLERLGGYVKHQPHFECHSKKMARRVELTKQAFIDLGEEAHLQVLTSLLISAASQVLLLYHWRLYVIKPNILLINHKNLP
jgi:hypothetical protein